MKVDIRDLKELDDYVILKIKSLAIERQKSRRLLVDKKTSFLNSFYKKRKDIKNPKIFDPKSIISMA